MTTYSDTLSETLGVSSALRVSWAPPALTSGIKLSPTVAVVRAVAASLSDTLTLTDAAIGSYGQVIREHLSIALVQAVTAHYHSTAADTITLTDRLLPGVPVTVAETLSLSLTQLVQRGVVVAERLGLSDVFAPAFKYQRSVAETIRLADSFANFFGAEISESLGLADTLVGTAAFAGSVTEHLGLADSVTPRLLIRATITDALDFGDADVVNMIYSGEITEGIEFVAGYVAPDGSFTTWAINTRSAAVTEYSNYAFNSFAQIGNVYVGATSSGLYELVGDDDAGTDIVAQIKTGFAQWAGSRFTMFKGIYLGVRGEGDFVLKLETGDGKTYNYAVSTRNQRTTKVHLGKGLKARYFAFELISTGQDFDLDTIEFVPLVSDRRV